jgi:hypothetical protein
MQHTLHAIEQQQQSWLREDNMQVTLNRAQIGVNCASGIVDPAKPRPAVPVCPFPSNHYVTTALEIKIHLFG